MKEIVKYAVVTPKGDCVAILDGEDEVRASGYYLDTVTIVKLTDQMPEPKKMKKVAQYVYTNIHLKSIYSSDSLHTEEEAKQRCAKEGDKLIKWPYGCVIEVEDV